MFTFLLFINLSQSLFSQELLNSNFDNVTKNEINKLIKNYILDNPEIVIEAIELFQKKQSSNAIKKQKETIKSLSVELYDDTNSYFFGNENSELKIVEFIDYNCGYCKKNHEIMMNILNENNDIKYIIKELPILGESSLLASKFAINIYLVDGPKIYEKFYDKLMRHNSQLNFEILDKIAKKLLKQKFKHYRIGGFREIYGNDETVFNSPGYDIPTISITRVPFKEYHTNFDTPKIISEKNIFFEII